MRYCLNTAITLLADLLILNQRVKWFLYKLDGTFLQTESDPPCKDGNARFTMVPLKAKSEQKCLRYFRFSDSKSA